MCGFFCQEVILSSIYIVETVKILRNSLQPGTRKTMQQLIAVNVIIIIMDLALLGLEAASLYILETLTKGVLYSIKLKLEFAILGKLVNFVGGNRADSTDYTDEKMRKSSVGFVATGQKTSSIDQSMDVNDFVDLNKVNSDISHPSRPSGSHASRRKSTRATHGMDFEYDFARFEHVEDATRLDEVSSSGSSMHDANGTV